MSFGSASAARRRRAHLASARPGAPPRASRTLAGGGGNGAFHGPVSGNGMPPGSRRRRASRYRTPGRPRHRHPVLRAGLIAMLVVIGVVASGAGVVFAGYNIYKGELPDVATIAASEPPQDSFVYDATGRLIHVFHNDNSRHIHVALSDISRWARLATVDVEDRHFYTEGSWDLPRLVAAGFNNLTHGATQGGSTITEQLAKNSFLGTSAPRSLDYKIKEIVLGNEIASNFSKEQILEMYLNRIYYGNFATGIETASELYFLKPAKNLDLAEASLLAGLPQAPAEYDPLQHDPGVSINPAAKSRQHDVLRAMVSNGDISQLQAQQAFAEPLTVHPWTDSEPTAAPNFNGYLASWLVQHFGDSFLNPGGWRIYTTLDPAKQQLAEATVHAQIAANGRRYNMHDAALVSLDPRTGEVIDMVGSWDYNDPYFGQVNMATSQLDPGSTVKLFTYTAAIASGKYTMTTPILDAPYTWHLPGGQTYSPQDYDRHWHGVCQLKECLGNSLNMPAVKTEVATGIPYIDNVEIASGVRSLIDIDGNLPPPTRYAATLGDGITHGIKLIELADGAATIADMGVQHDPVPVTKIVDIGSGRTVFAYDAQRAARRAVPDNVAYIMDEITSNDANRAREFGAHGLLTLNDRRVSAKTGTGEDFKDNLTVGWTPEFLTAVWVGNPTWTCSASVPKGEPCGTLNGIASGITGAAPIWHDFMSKALAGAKADWYPRPSDVVASGPGDDVNFFLPSTQVAPPATGTCFYWGPSPEPGNPCQYTGTSPPSWYQPEGRPNPTPAPIQPPRKHPKPTPPPG